MRSLPVDPELTLNPTTVGVDGEAKGNMKIEETYYKANCSLGSGCAVTRVVGEQILANAARVEMKEGADGPMFADGDYQAGPDVKAPEQQQQPRVSDLSAATATVEWSALYLRDAPLVASQLVIQLGGSSDATIDVPADAGPTTELAVTGSSGLSVELLQVDTTAAPTFRLRLSGLAADSAYTVSSRVSTRGGFSPLSDPTPMATSPDDSGDKLLAWLLPVVIGIPLAVLTALVVLWYRRRHGEVFLLRDTRKPPTLTLAPGKKWHTFLSHTCVRPSRSRDRVPPLPLVLALRPPTLDSCAQVEVGAGPSLAH